MKVTLGFKSETIDQTCRTCVFAACRRSDGMWTCCEDECLHHKYEKQCMHDNGHHAKHHSHYKEAKISHEDIT